MYYKMETLDQYIDFLLNAFNRKMSPRIDAKERLIRLIDEHYAHLSDNQRSSLVWLVLKHFMNLTVVRKVPHHAMRLRSHV